MVPSEPDITECCGSGCNPCIFDVYKEQMKNYKKETKNDSNYVNCISQTSYSIFQLIKIEYCSEDANLYTFKFIKSKEIVENVDVLRLIFYPGQHFLLRGTDEEDKYFTRAYTPIYNDHLTFTVLIKLYENGKMSKFINNLKIDSESLWRGPYGNYQINFKLKNILMICQGTGIAPLITIINEIVKNDECETFLKLFYCCRKDIYLRNDVYNLSSYWNFTYDVFLNTDLQFEKKYNENIHWRKLKESDVQKYFHSSGRNNKDDVQVLICGSDTFSKTISNYVKCCNVTDDSIYIF